MGKLLDSGPFPDQDIRAWLAKVQECSPAELVEVLQHDQQRRWRRGQWVPVETYLQLCPALAQRPEEVLDLVVGESLLRQELGEAPKLDEYLLRFPHLADSLRAEFDLEQLLAAQSRSTLVAGRGRTAAAGLPWQGRELALPGYEILGELGRGGMGVVYKARHLALDRVVALKMLLAGADAHPDDLARFRSEGEAAARLQHSNIVQIYEVGEHQGLPYFALEFVDGGSLADALDGTPWPAARAAALVETLARAAHAAHQRGIIHRDLKPANVLLVADGTPKLGDFGLAKRVEGDSLGTKTGVILGTPSYMAPEQAAARTDLGPAADVYSLGAILYELLTGRPPFRAETVMETLFQVVQHEPVRPRRLQPKLPRDLETVCLKSLEKDPQRRYAGALDLAEDLRRFQEGLPTRARPVGPAGRAAHWARRRPGVAALLAALVLVSVAGIAAVAWRWGGEVVARRGAERLAVSLALDQAISSCERSDPIGPLALVRSLEEIRQLGDADLERVARINLAAWLPRAWRRGRSYGVPGKTGFVWRLALSRDGRTLATANHDDGAQLWDVASGRQLRVLGPPRQVFAVAISPDGQTLLTGTGQQGKPGGAVQRWDPAGRPKGPPLAQPHGVTTVAFRPPDGKTFLSVSGNVVRLWSGDTGQPIGPEMRHPAFVLNAVFSPDGRLLASAAADGLVRFWDADTGRSRGRLPPHPAPVWDVAFSPSGRLLATASGIPGKAGGEVRVWSRNPQQLVAGPINHPDCVRSVAFGSGGALLVTGCHDRYLRYFDVHTAGPVDRPVPVHYAVQALLPADKGRSLFFATVGDSPGAHRVTLPRPAAPTLRRSTEHQMWTIAFDRTGRRVALGGGAKRALLWKLPAGDPLPLASQPNDEVWTVAFHPGANQLLTGGKRVCRLWDLDSGQLLREIRQPDTVICLAYRRDGRGFAVGCRDGTARVWDGDGERAGPVLRHGGTLEWLAFTPDGKALLTAGKDGRLRKWDPDQGTLLYESAESGEILSGGLSPDGRLAATVVNRRPLRLWDARTGLPQPSPLAARTGPLRAARFSPDGRTLVAAGSDFQVRLWDVPTAKPLGPPLAHTDEVFWAVFSPDGSQVATTCADKHLRLWKVDTPLTGSVAAIRLRVESATGLELGPAGELRQLDEDAIEQRRRLAEIDP